MVLIHSLRIEFVRLILIIFFVVQCRAELGQRFQASCTCALSSDFIKIMYRYTIFVVWLLWWENNDVVIACSTMLRSHSNFRAMSMSGIEDCLAVIIL